MKKRSVKSEKELSIVDIAYIVGIICNIAVTIVQIVLMLCR